MGAIPHLTRLLLFRTKFLLLNTNLQSISSSSSSSSSQFLYRQLSTSNSSSHLPLFTRISPSSSSSFTVSMNSNATTNDDAETNSPPPISTKTVRVVVKGRVQGVFYRNWTIENAKGLGLNGWVRNRRDGSVEALFSGDSNSVHEMEQRCRRGPPDALVTHLQVFPSNEDPGQGFHRHSTF